MKKTPIRLCALFLSLGLAGQTVSAGVTPSAWLACALVPTTPDVRFVQEALSAPGAGSRYSGTFGRAATVSVIQTMASSRVSAEDEEYKSIEDHLNRIRTSLERPSLSRPDEHPDLQHILKPELERMREGLPLRTLSVSPDDLPRYRDAAEAMTPLMTVYSARRNRRLGIPQGLLPTLDHLLAMLEGPTQAVQESSAAEETRADTFDMKREEGIPLRLSEELLAQEQDVERQLASVTTRLRVETNKPLRAGLDAHRNALRSRLEAIRARMRQGDATPPESSQKIRFFGSDSYKHWSMALFSVVDMAERDEWPEPLRPLYDAGIRVTSSRDLFTYEQKQERSWGEHWYLFEKPHMSISGIRRIGESETRTARALGSVLTNHGVSGILLADHRLEFSLDPKAGTYRLTYRSPGLKTDAKAIKALLNNLLASYPHNGRSLPDKITLQGMNDMVTTFTRLHTIDIPHPALIVGAGTPHALMYINIHTLRAVADFERLSFMELQQQAGQMSIPVGAVLRDLEPLLHETTHAVASPGVWDDEFATVVHSWVNMVQAVVRKAGEAALFPTSYVWVVFHALNPSGNRDELTHLAMNLEEVFRSHRRTQITIPELRQWVDDWVQRTTTLSRRSDQDLTSVLSEDAGIPEDQAKVAAQAILKTRMIQFSSTPLKPLSSDQLFLDSLQLLTPSFVHLVDFLRTVSGNRAALLEGTLNVHVPEELTTSQDPLEDLVPRLFPESHRRITQAAQHGLFDALPLAFDPEQSMGPYVAVVDKDAQGRPYRFLDFGDFGAKAFGDNRLEIIQDLLARFHNLVDRYAHSEYQTALSLEFMTMLGRIAPYGCPKAFICNTGAESVENAIKAALFKQELEPGEVPTDENAFLIHYNDAFHGRSMGALAATRSRKARQGFPTFDWPSVPFPYARFVDGVLVDNDSLNERERISLRDIWDLFVLGRNPNKNRPKRVFKDNLESIDQFLNQLYNVDLANVTDKSEREKIKAARVNDFLVEARKSIKKEHLIRAENVTGIIVEPIQGEGGIRIASARYFQRLRMLSLLYEVPLLFDEVQTGFGRTGTFWAHEQFDLPAPPDVVVTAKVAQMGIVFVSERMAKFFDAEKRFNTTWAGEPAGMLRVLRYVQLLDLKAIRALGDYAVRELLKVQKRFPSLIASVRGRGLMIGLSIPSSDKQHPSQARDALQENLFRRGLILNRAGEETLRFYPRFDDHPLAIDRAVDILSASLGPPLLSSQGHASPPQSHTLRRAA